LGNLFRKGYKEAGSLGEARQVPLSPVGNPAENIPLQDPETQVFVSQNWLGPSSIVGLVDLSKFAQQRFSRMPVRRSLFGSLFELQPLSTMMSGSI
jgi:hypothetical protein